MLGLVFDSKNTLIQNESNLCAGQKPDIIDRCASPKHSVPDRNDEMQLSQPACVIQRSSSGRPDSSRQLEHSSLFCARSRLALHSPQLSPFARGRQLLILRIWLLGSSFTVRRILTAVAGSHSVHHEGHPSGLRSCRAGDVDRQYVRSRTRHPLWQPTHSSG